MNPEETGDTKTKNEINEINGTCCVDTGDMMVGDPQSWSVSLLYLPRFCVFVTVTKEVLYSPGMDPDR